MNRLVRAGHLRNVEHQDVLPFRINEGLLERDAATELAPLPQCPDEAVLHLVCIHDALDGVAAIRFPDA